ncbi:hypothetical protein PGTUg99_019315 [Puccinia graminis f. sp. tritici]|uniref:Uncharacterized protein n=1 Tax=Puccinia graminis f. sp. tritici TaxID=56615 RepID=A0A5B0RPB0_PUCGR|nr:hypothetical protein PGTUg99_019315 [Puccinia graminis f. sp. tritici]
MAHWLLYKVRITISQILQDSQKQALLHAITSGKFSSIVNRVVGEIIFHQSVARIEAIIYEIFA